MADVRLSYERAWDVIDRYGADHADVYAGAYEGGAGEPRHVTLWTERAEEHARAVSELTGRVVGGRQVRWTLAHLHGIHDRLGSDVDEWDRRGVDICLFGTDIVENVQRIGVTGLTPEIERALRERYGDAIEVREEEVIAA